MARAIANALTLPARETHALLTEKGAEAAWQGVEELGGIRCLGGGADLRLCGARSAEADILPRVGAEDHRILWHQSHQILAGFFRASRIALVTSLRDGMNLVAKEYVASQPADDPGVLILSCFAGAARELGEAVIVNPFDVEGMAEAILRGLNMPVGERKERWVAMMKVLERNDISAWRERFVRALSAIDTQR
jgi:hypothetical protein